MYDDDDDGYNEVSFSYRSKTDGVRCNITRTVNDKEQYSDIAQEFVFFMQSMGYNYIYGITLHGERGEDLHTTTF